VYVLCHQKYGEGNGHAITEDIFYFRPFTAVKGFFILYRLNKNNNFKKIIL